MKKKKLKIVKTDLFKKQVKKLPKDVKKELNKALDNISKNPLGAIHTMSIFGEPSPKELRQWMGRVRPETIDLVLEYLDDKDCLKVKGKKLARDFWEKYIKEEDEE